MICIILAAICFALSLFLFLSEVIGLYRFNYVLTRMHATALGDTFGILFAVLGVILLRGLSMASWKMLLVPVFLFLTGPVVTHLIAQCEVLYHRPSHEEYRREDRR